MLVRDTKAMGLRESPHILSHAILPMTNSRTYPHIPASISSHVAIPDNRGPSCCNKAKRLGDLRIRLRSGWGMHVTVSFAVSTYAAFRTTFGPEHDGSSVQVDQRRRVAPSSAPFSLLVDWYFSHFRERHIEPLVSPAHRIPYQSTLPQIQLTSNHGHLSCL